VNPLAAPREGVPAVVETRDALRATVTRLAAGSGPFAIDAERASGYRYSQRAYLIQIRREGGGTHLIDPTAVDDLAPLAELVSEEEWVLHAASQDLACLRAAGLEPSRLFDTELAGRLLGRPRVGLATMIAEEFGLHLAKEHSAADWSVRPIPPEWLTYAALDVEFLLELRGRLEVQLREHGREEWARQEFAALLVAVPSSPGPEPWRRTSHITDVRTPRGLAVVRELWEARDAVARDLDLAPGRVLPDRVIVAVASRSPLPDELPPLKELRRHAPAVWQAAYRRALSLPDAELPSRRPPGRGGLPDPRQWSRLNQDAAARLDIVRSAVRRLAEELGMPQENLLAPAAQRALAWHLAHPDEAGDLLRSAGARPWQVELVAHEVTTALTGTTPVAGPPPGH